MHVFAAHFGTPRDVRHCKWRRSGPYKPHLFIPATEFVAARFFQFLVLQENAPARMGRASRAIAVSRCLMSTWFTPPVVVPVFILLLVVVYAMARQ
jgi:hypothetical protein